MHLDVVTLAAMGSFVSACTGAILIFAWLQNRKTLALGIWGLAHIVKGLGIASLMLASAFEQQSWATLGATLLTLAPGLIWKAAKTFDARPAPLILAAVGAALVGLFSTIPGMSAFAGAFSLAACSTYLFVATASFRPGGKESLAARWPMIIFMALHASILFIGACATFSGSISEGEIPAVMSVFGLIHFEDIIYTLGTAVFILALVKERHHAASEKAARIDPLSGIANRAAFMESAVQVIELCQRENAPVSVVMCDFIFLRSSMTLMATRLAMRLSESSVKSLPVQSVLMMYLVA